MRDITQVLDPAVGVVGAHNLLPVPLGSGRMWSVGAQVACEHAADGALDVLPTCQTGACSLDRTIAFLRTAGEAVERVALHGGPHRVATCAEVGTSAVPFFSSDLALGEDPGARRLRWYAGTSLRHGTEVLVPAGLVDYPAAAQDRTGFDPGPSGAAAGDSHASALKGALLEAAERDAVIVAWARQAQLRILDIDALVVAAPTTPSWSLLSRTLDVARSAGLVPVFAEVPTSLAGVTCVVGGFRAPGADRTLLCLGAKASDHVGRALLGAFEESFQLYFGLQGSLGPALGEPSPAVITGDVDRVRFLASPDGVQALETWLADARPPATSLDRPLAARLSTEDLVSNALADGLDAIVLDLSDRLPEPVRAAGWVVVKVVPAGYQPLRIDERHAFGWNRLRLDSFEARTGATARIPPGQVCALPHPLP